MRYAVLLRQRADGKYQAMVPLLPDLSRVGDTRDETLAAIQQAIETTLIATELVYLEVPQQSLVSDNPWLTTAGMFKDDPTLDAMLQQIYDERDLI